MNETLVIWAEHTTMAGRAVTVDVIEAYGEDSDDFVTIALDVPTMERHESLKSNFGWRVAELIRERLGLNDDDDDYYVAGDDDVVNE